MKEELKELVKILRNIIEKSVHMLEETREEIKVESKKHKDTYIYTEGKFPTCFE